MPQETQQLDASKLLSDIFAKNQGDLARSAISAATPIPGGHATQFPLSMDPTPRQNQPGQLNHEPVVGAGNAKAQGIGNSVIAVTNLLAGTKNALDNKKRVEVASATQQLLTAQQAYDQAEQLYKQNPQNADAKAAMDRNKAVMNGILANDKIRGAISKGMNIDFTDPQANKTLEHEGVAQGKKMAKEHVDYAGQFNQKTPQVMAPNTQAIAAYQAKLQEQKLNVETMRAFIPLINAQMRSQDAAANRENRLSVEQMRQARDNARATAKSEDAWKRLNKQISARAAQAKTQFGYRMAEIGAEGTKELEVFKAKLQAKNADPTQQLKAYNEFQNHNSRTLSALNTTLTTMQQLRATLSAKKSIDEQNAAGVQELDQNIELIKNQVKTFGDYTGAMDDYYKALNPEKGGPNAGSSSSSSVESKHSISAADTYLDDDTDPDDDEN
jgi:hypothetical protein